MIIINGIRVFKKVVMVKRIFFGLFINVRKIVEYIFKEVLKDDI